MRKAKSKTVAVGLAAIGMSLVASSAWAYPYLPGLTNLNFQTLNGSGPKSYFTSADPAGWTGGNGLIFHRRRIAILQVGCRAYLPSDIWKSRWNRCPGTTWKRTAIPPLRAASTLPSTAWRWAPPLRAELLPGREPASRFQRWDNQSVDRFVGGQWHIRRLQPRKSVHV